MNEKVERLLTVQNYPDQDLLKSIELEDLDEFWRRSDEQQKKNVISYVFGTTDKDEIRAYILNRLRNSRYREVPVRIEKLFKPKKQGKKNAKAEQYVNPFEMQFDFVQNLFPGLYALFQAGETHFLENWCQLNEDAELIMRMARSKELNPDIGMYIRAKLSAVLEIVRSLTAEQDDPQCEDAVRFLAAFMQEPQIASQVQSWMTEPLRLLIEELQAADFESEDELPVPGAVTETGIEGHELPKPQEPMHNCRIETTGIPVSPEGRAELLLELLKMMAEEGPLDRNAISILMADELGRLWLNKRMRSMPLEDRFRLVSANEENGNLGEALRLLFNSVDDVPSLKQCLERLRLSRDWYQEWLSSCKELTVALALSFEQDRICVLPFMREYKFLQTELLIAATQNGISLYEWLDYACEQLDGEELSAFLSAVSAHPRLQSGEEIRKLAQRLTEAGKMGGLQRPRDDQGYFWDELPKESVRLLTERLSERSNLLEKERHQKDHIQREQVNSTAKALREYCEQFQSRLVYYMGPSGESISSHRIVSELLAFHASFIEALGEISSGHPNLRRLRIETVVPVNDLGKEVEYEPELHSFQSSYISPGEACKVVSLGMKYTDGEQSTMIWKATVEPLQQKEQDDGNPV